MSEVPPIQRRRCHQTEWPAGSEQNEKAISEYETKSLSETRRIRISKISPLDLGLKARADTLEQDDVNHLQEKRGLSASMKAGRSLNKRATDLAKEEPDGKLLGRLLKRVSSAANLSLELALAPSGDLGPLVGVEPATLEDLVHDPTRFGLAD